MNYIDEIKYEDLTQDLQMISDIIGLENVLKIIVEVGGINFYFPKITKLEKFIIRYIKENNHKSVKILAMELKVSDQYIRNTIKNKKFD